MSTNFLNSNELLEKAITEKLYLNLVVQLQKDFTLANVDVNFTFDSKPKEIQDTLKEKIYFLILEKFMMYINLMYIIDVPEKAFKEIKETDVVALAKQVSFLILKREWQKVWYKAKYNS